MTKFWRDYPGKHCRQISAALGDFEKDSADLQRLLPYVPRHRAEVAA